MLKGVECGSSNSLCINHFETNGYTISKSGIYSLERGAVPSLFDIFLIEVEESSNCAVKIDELNAFKCENEKLRREFNQMANKFESEKLIASTRIDHLNDIKKSQIKEIRSFKQKTTYLENTLEQLRKTITDMKEGNLSVNLDVCFAKHCLSLYIIFHIPF